MTTRNPLARWALFAASVIAAGNAVAQTSISIPAADIKFAETGVGRLQAAKGFGDLAQGAHGTFVKLPAGYATPLHKHSHDYYGVVISGVVANEPTAADKDRPMPAGSYWFQKGHAAHVTKCVSNTDCVTFISQPGKFDFTETR